MSSRRKGRTIQLAVPLPSSAQRADPARPLIALLVPGGRDHAGGIGRWAGYLHDSWTAQRLLPELELIDTRSTGHAGRAALAFARALIRLGWLHATGRLGTVHANVAKRGSTVRKWIVSILTHNLRIPLVLHLHGSGYDRFFAELPAFWQRRVRIMFGRADRVVVLGQYWADWATETLQIAPERLHILHNGVAMPVRQDRVPGPCRILLLGRLGARKGVPELLTALASPALRERAWTATLAGDGELDRYRRDVDRSGQADRITLPGWLDLTDVASLLAQADILVLPSHAENFPISIIEALAATVAVIATPVGATPRTLTRRPFRPLRSSRRHGRAGAGADPPDRPPRSATCHRGCRPRGLSRAPRHRRAGRPPRRNPCPALRRRTARGDMLIRHSALYIGAKLLPGALGMLTTALLTRILPPDQYGIYGVALVITSFGATLGFEWLGLAYLRLAAAPGDAGRAGVTFGRLFAVLLAAAAFLGAISLALLPPTDRPIVLAGFLMMASYAWFEFRARLPVAALRPGVYLRMNLSRGALILVAACAAAWLTRNPVWTAIATAAATLAASFGSRSDATQRGGAFDRTLALASLRFGLPLAASLALNSATGSLTRALVGGLGSVTALGLYTAAFVLVQNTLVVLSSGVAAAGFSLAVRALESGDAAAARRQLSDNGALLLAVLAPASLGMGLCADSIAATLVGPQFRDTVATLTPWLAAAALLTGFRAHYLDHAFQLGHAIGQQVWVTATAATVTLGLDAILIPRDGPRGAAIAVLVGAAASVLHAAIAGRAAFAIPLPLAQAARIVASCTVMAVCVLAIPASFPAALAAKIAVGTCSYAVAAIGFDVIGSRGSFMRHIGLATGRPA